VFVAELLALCAFAAVRCAAVRLQLRHHPDKGGDEETSKELNLAMDFLCSVALLVLIL
jgi:curved DNA-binding protein CbpA